MFESVLVLDLQLLSVLVLALYKGQKLVSVFESELVSVFEFLLLSVLV